MSDTREGTIVSTSGRLITQGPPLADLLDDAGGSGNVTVLIHYGGAQSRCDRSRRLSQHATRVRLWTHAGVLAGRRTRGPKLRTRPGTVRAGKKREDSGTADRVGVAPSDHRPGAAVPDPAGRSGKPRRDTARGRGGLRPPPRSALGRDPDARGGHRHGLGSAGRGCRDHRRGADATIDPCPDRSGDQLARSRGSPRSGRGVRGSAAGARAAGDRSVDCDERRRRSAGRGRRSPGRDRGPAGPTAARSDRDRASESDRTAGGGRDAGRCRVVRRGRRIGSHRVGAQGRENPTRGRRDSRGSS